MKGSAMSRPTALRSTLVLAALLGALASPAAHAEGWQWLPLFNDPAFKPDFSLAITGARVMPRVGPDANAWGLDLNMNCGLLQTPDRRLRTHLNYSHVDKDGVKVDGYELSPRYTVPVAGVAGLSLGAGPSLGLFKVDAGAISRTLSGLGVAAGLNYRMGALYTGVDLRWHATAARSGVDLDPLTLSAKIGINF